MASDKALQTLYTQKQKQANKTDEDQKIFFSKRSKLTELDNQTRNSRKNKDQIEALIQQLKDKLTDTQLQQNNVVQRLSVEFEIDAQTLYDMPITDQQPIEKLKERTTQLKKTLDNYGSINPLAIEAYQEIEQRFNFIAAEKNDLILAKKDLIDTITQIDLNAKILFMDAFQVIRTHFQDVFQTLFSQEDICDLILTDPQNPLESYINIVAKPKGKKPLTINQLSGGEKTLTATALLFAIYLYKPAPFCIFDEVDAPLDDANIDKFNNIIKRFSDKSQFIIVTHNKKTMLSTDIIYGVTMVEQGVSKVVPVDLRSLN